MEPSSQLVQVCAQIHKLLVLPVYPSFNHDLTYDGSCGMLGFLTTKMKTNLTFSLTAARSLS